MAWWTDFFIFNVVGKTAFTSVNIIIPYLQIIGGGGAVLDVGDVVLTCGALSLQDRSLLSFFGSWTAYGSPSLRVKY